MPKRTLTAGFGMARWRRTALSVEANAYGALDMRRPRRDSVLPVPNSRCGRDAFQPHPELAFIEVAHGHGLNTPARLAHAHGYHRWSLIERCTIDENELAVACEATAAETPAVTDAAVRHAPLHRALEFRKCPSRQRIDGLMLPPCCGCGRAVGSGRRPHVVSPWRRCAHVDQRRQQLGACHRLGIGFPSGSGQRAENLSMRLPAKQVCPRELRRFPRHQRAPGMSWD
ncbi:hypothetical protein E9229_002427 [Paeniglutamicibacter cryotolerans]|uniref:Uncharacterized protein n=1 Tax=Paeniglutamicibacter cryotolerans TaxID=670079 RepID=A0A839QQG6_9MICC|nr:hypothetical protein [Paeniglutamicibacter cryotolerans]